MRDAASPERTLSRRPIWLLLDVLVALVFVWVTFESLRSQAYVSEFGPIEGLGWLLALSPTVLLPLRRVAPSTMLVVSTVLYMVISAFQGDSNAPLAIPFYAYAVGMTRPLSLSAWMVAGASVAMSTSVFYGPGEPLFLSIPVTFLLYATGWTVAAFIRRSQSEVAELADEADELRQRAEEVAAEAVAEERSRLARELHDAVGHAVNVMVMQAGAARMVATDDRSIRALTDIEQVGRSALSDLDHMLGLLNTPDGPAPLTPVRGISDIPDLIAEMRSSGMDARLIDECTSSATIEQSIAAAAYRIVQESLTNSLKHAGPTAHVEVRLRCADRELRISVTDDGVAPPGTAAHAGGRGIVGMRERASLLGGSLETGRRPDGGFVVEAGLPLTPMGRPASTAGDRPS